MAEIEGDKVTVREMRLKRAVTEREDELKRHPQLEGKEREWDRLTEMQLK